MALEIEQPALVVNGEVEKDDCNVAINHKIAKLNGVESALNGHENGHSDALITDSPRDKRSKNRSAKSTPSKSKKKTAKVADTNSATDDENKSENSSSIFSKDTEDDAAVTEDYDASAEFVDISLALTPDPDDEEEIDVGKEEKQEEKKVEAEAPPAQEVTILSSLRDRIRLSLSPKPQETKSEEKETPDLSTVYKGISGRRPLRSPTEASRPVFKQTETVADDTSLKRKAEADSYSLQAKKSRHEGWSFSPLKWFSPKRHVSADHSHRKLHDEIEVMVVEEVVEQVENQPTAVEKKAESAAEHEPEKIVADEVTKVEAPQDEFVAPSKSGKTWSSCSVM